MVFTSIKKSTIKKTLCLLLIIVTLIFTISGTGAYQVFYGKNFKRLPIYYVKTDKKQIAISFDCAWGTDYTDKLLETMQKEQVKCTFFMVEFWTEKYPDYVKKIYEAGHEIGTHSSTHPHMTKLSAQEMEKELATSMSAIEKIVGEKPKVFRPPYGDYNDLLIKTAENLGLYTIQWDVDSLDWKNLSASEISSRVLKKVKNGSIVLFHNQGLHTAEALPTIIATLKQQGYQFLPVGDLIYKENYTMLSDGGQQRNP